MKRNRLLKNSICLLAPVLLLQVSFVQAKTTGLVSAFVTEYRASIDKLNIPALTLSYVTNLNNLGSISNLERQQAIFADYKQRIGSLNQSTLNTCQQIEMASITNEITLGEQRAKLGLDLLKGNKGEISKGGLYTVKSGKQWYLYFLKAWLGADVAPDALFGFGEAQLLKAVADYRRVQAKMGFAGNDKGLQKHLAGSQYHWSDHKAVLNRYKRKQQLVAAKMGDLFYDYKIEPTRIKKSEQGNSVPVPGWFERPNKFVYNVFGSNYDIRQMDWLFIHEATPGHHFHVAAREKQAKCARPNSGPPVFSEGWAAYVETMGQSLGLYQTPAEQLGAIEWNMIRSARVALDVGINYYGWSNDKALVYWQKNVVGQQDKALREINRMRNWPVQVITYKYGADVFERMKEHYLQAQGKGADVRKYHDIAMSYGLMPMGAFEQLIKGF